METNQLKQKLFLSLIGLICSSLSYAYDYSEKGYDFTVGGIFYKILNSSSKTVAVSYKELRYEWYGPDYINSGYSGSVVIPSTVSNGGASYKVVAIGNSAFDGSTITSVTMPNTIESIGSGSFIDCIKLKSITIPNSVKSIDRNAFNGCSGLTSITIPSSVTSIGTSAFEGCKGITTVSIPNSITSIGSSVFSSCSGLKSVTIPNSVTSIGSSAFVNCSGLTSINIPSSVTSIGTSAFSGCSSLTSITIPNSVISIGTSAFYGCKGITTVSIPNSITSIGSSVFSGCSGLKSVTIPNSVTSIGSSAFVNCSGLTSITIPSSVTSIGAYAFDCSGITSVTVFCSPASVGSDIFTDCGKLKEAVFDCETITPILKGNTSLEKVTIKECVTSIGSNAFEGCSGLTSISVPQNVTSIGSNVFKGCNGLKSIALDCKDVSTWFGGLTGIESVTIGEGVESIAESAFSQCSSLKDVTIGKNVTSIGYSAFANCKLNSVISNIEDPYWIDYSVFQYSLSSNTVLYVPKGKKEAYKSTSSWNQFPSIVELSDEWDTDIDMTIEVLSEVDKTVRIGNGKVAAISVDTSGEMIIPSTVTKNGRTYKVISLADSAFYNCNKLTSVVIPANITSSGKDAFLGCNGLQRLIISDLKAWCAIAFSNKYSNPLYYAKHLYKNGNTEITDLIIPDGVPNIEPFTFVKGLFKTVSIPSCVSEVRSNSFYKCISLTTIKLAEGVNKIRTNAFYGCTALTSVSLPKTMTRIGTSAFYQCTALEAIELPSSISEIGNTAFKLCSNLKQVTANNLSPKAFGTESFASIADDCKLFVPVLTLPKYHSVGWTKEVFGGGVVEVGDVVENFCLENGVTSEFIKNVTYPNDDYSYTKITDYTTQTTSYRKDLPMPVRIEVPATNEGDSLILETYSEGLLARSDTFLIGQRALEIWNLIPQTSYTYKLFVLNSDKTKSEILGGSFETTGQVRMMKIDYMGNFRDIGGWKLPNGQYVKYDKIFRSAELTEGDRNITSAGINELINIQDIGVEIDFGGASDASPVENLLEFVHGSDYQIVSYVNGVKSSEGKIQYKNCFEKVVNSLRKGKKVLFHCSWGADRTGTFALLLEGLLGVSESDLAKDYELTCFVDKYKDRFRSANGVGYKGLIDYIKTFKGETINEKIEQMALNFGISQKDINDFRGLMSECNTLSVTDVSIAKGKTAQLPVYMDNLNDITAFQFYVEVPKGITLTDAVLSERKSSSHSVQYIKQDDGVYKVMGVSTMTELFSGNDGKLVNLKLSASNDMELGNYDVMVKDILLTTPTQQKFHPSNISAVLSVLEYLEGDADGDGVIDVADIVAMVNSIMGQPSPNFVKKAADLNGDGEVDIFDVMLAINLVLNQKGSNRSKTRGADIDNALQMMDMMSANDGIKLNIANAESYSAFQFDVEVPDGSELLEARLIGSEDTHIIKFDQIGENRYKIMSVSLNNSPLRATADGMLILSFSNNSGSLAMIDNIKFVTQDGEKAYFAVSHGNSATTIKEIRVEQEEMIYDLSGRRVTYSRESLPKGIYIISNKKVVIK